ncbi:hypothetical protein VNO78_19029 [Psophocarpus tetragonolobus]|uniref:Uncharacterized protein n=1 Tax=Psophocarpus tetragonolobus TaxID=3891 RepID=A0AAN9S7R6_PSOTE
MLTNGVSVYPFFLSQTPSLANTLCKWGALILPLLATFLIIRFRQNTPSIPLLVADYDYSDTDDDDDDDDKEEISSTSEFEEEEEEEDDDRSNEYFRVTGSSNEDGLFLRRRSVGDFLSLPEMANSESVVKLWDTIGFGLGLGLDYSSSDGSVVSVYHGERELRPDPPVLVSAGENASGNLAVRIWDARLRRRILVVIAEWGPTLGKTVGVESCGVHKVYVNDDGRYGFTVGDIRNATSPLQSITDSHLHLWWPNSFLIKI